VCVRVRLCGDARVWVRHPARSAAAYGRVCPRRPRVPGRRRHGCGGTPRAQTAGARSIAFPRSRAAPRGMRMVHCCRHTPPNDRQKES
jgi:hypothetical protein